ncbi:MAG: hypothetical protein KFF68_05360 [Desulfosarcina sp.]|nr:hypothetical protein [Desulfosarcina sp.]
MHRLGSRIHALVGLWILAGLVVAGANGAMLMSLLDDPLAGYSGGVRMADQGFRTYRTRVTAQAEKITSGMDLLIGRFKSGDVEEEKPVVQQPSAPPSSVKTKAPAPVALPTLTGILTSRSSDGDAMQLAVLDGRICAEGDRLDNLTVMRIARGGVSLVKGDQAWFLPAPDLAYSLTTQ